MFFWIEFGLAALTVVIAFSFPNLGSGWFKGAERLLSRLGQHRGWAVVTAGVTALVARAALLPILPIPQPGVHDEFGYLLLADTFAHGRVTNPTHPMWVHFETFHIIWKPTYTAMFYPAQGLMMAVGQVIMGHPFWGVWLSVGLMCAAICWMLQGWMPPGWALLGGLLAAVRFGTFSYWADSYWGGAVAAIGGALVVGAMPRLKQLRGLRYALLAGLGFAIVANSRPYEGLFFGATVVGAFAYWTFGKSRPPLRLVGKHIVLPVGLILALTGCAMGYYFWRTTGSPWDTPFLVGMRTYYPASLFPWQPLRPIPVYHHAVMRKFCVDLVHSHNEARSFTGRTKISLNSLYTFAMFFLGPALGLPLLAGISHHGGEGRGFSPAVTRPAHCPPPSPPAQLAAASCAGGEANGGGVPAIAAGLKPRPSGVAGQPPRVGEKSGLAAFATLFRGFSRRRISPSTGFLLLVCGVVLGCSLIPISYSPHYEAPIACALLCLVLRAMRRLCDRPAGLFIARGVPAICLVMLVLRIGAKPLHLPEPRPRFQGGAPIWCAPTPSIPARGATLARLQALPGRQLAIVRYGPDHDVYFNEWVYNEADIDQAKVVWARDMGAVENQHLIDYFHDRCVWLVEPDLTPPGLRPYFPETSPAGAQAETCSPPKTASPHPSAELAASS